MTAKEFLSQAYHLDQRIESKLELASSLNTLAQKCTSAISGMPHNPSGSTSRMADTVSKIVDLRAEINQDIDSLVEISGKIHDIINAVPLQVYRVILEKRYLCLESWEEIASDLGYEQRWLYRLHSKAIKEIQNILDNQEIDQ